MTLHFIYSGGKWNDFFASLAERAAKAAGAIGEISVLLADDETIRSYNREWRGIDEPTNVLSFETGDKALPGDIIVSYDTLEREAKERGIPLEAHFAHLFLHGLLHLAGHDHMADADAEKMEAREAEILAELGYENPYI